MRTTEVESIWMKKRNISVLPTQLTLQYVMKMTYATVASTSSGKWLTTVSTATWVRNPATGELTFRHRQGQRTDTWQHVTSLDHFCEVRIPLYNSKKKKMTYTQYEPKPKLITNRTKWLNQDETNYIHSN